MVVRSNRLVLYSTTAAMLPRSSQRLRMISNLAAVAPGDWRAHADVLLAAVSRQQRLPRGHQDHEQSATVPLAQGVKRGGDGGAQREAVVRAACRSDGGPGAIGGQLQKRRCSRKLRLP